MPTHQLSGEERQAARDYLEHDYTRHRLSGEPAYIAHENARELENRYPGIRERALAATADELGNLPAHLRRHQMRTRRSTGIDSKRAERIRRGYRKEPRPPSERQGANPRPNSPARTSPSSAGRTVRRYASSAWDAGTGSSWGQLIVQVFTWGMALSIGYLLLTHNKGASKLAEGASNVTRALVSTRIDPLNPSGINLKH